MQRVLLLTRPNMPLVGVHIWFGVELVKCLHSSSIPPSTHQKDRYGVNTPAVPLLPAVAPTVYTPPGVPVNSRIAVFPAGPTNEPLALLLYNGYRIYTYIQACLPPPSSENVRAISPTYSSVANTTGIKPAISPNDSSVASKMPTSMYMSRSKFVVRVFYG